MYFPPSYLLYLAIYILRIPEYLPSYLIVCFIMKEKYIPDIILPIHTANYQPPLSIIHLFLFFWGWKKIKIYTHQMAHPSFFKQLNQIVRFK